VRQGCPPLSPTQTMTNTTRTLTNNDF
jgi:hypothetical protein